MQIFYTTRQKARDFAAKRNSNGHPSFVKDYGKNATKRYAVDISIKAGQYKEAA